ncbi:MAG: hypothetical protein GTO16_05760 [Candidatus Aminicenantes bacterium]|nr:hypothetical protein [Candidatus Aminicenantes bacterium]NIN92125.1 hypothetical protein [bacterium]
MEEYRRNGQEGKSVFVGVDLHRFKWHVTVRTEDQVPVKHFWEEGIPETLCQS